MSKSKLKRIMVVGRMIWSDIYTKKVDDYNPNGKYILKLLIDMQDSKTVKALVDAISEVGAAFGGTYETSFLKECNEANNLEDWNGNYLMTAKSDFKPEVINTTGCPENNVYNGCYVASTITLVPYNIGGKRGVTAYLGNICKLADGEELGKKEAVSDFASIIGKPIDNLLPNNANMGIETTGEDIISDGNIPF